MHKIGVFMLDDDAIASGIASPETHTFESPKPVLLLAYGCYLILPPVGLSIAYLKRGELSDTIYLTHADWLIGTFWYGFVFCVLAVLATTLTTGDSPLSAMNHATGFARLTTLIPMLAGPAVAIWYLHRIVKGGLRLYAEKSV
jgi:uncharacterized membrane protein